MAYLIDTTSPQGVGNGSATAEVVLARGSANLCGNLKRFLAERHPSWTLVEVGSHQAVLDLVHACRCDLLLLDADLLSQSGGDPPSLWGIGDGPRVIVMGVQTDRTFIRRWLDAGARGYLPKSADPAQVDCAIRTVLLGGMFMPLSVAAPVTGTPDFRAGPSPEATLTARQQQVFELLLLGLSTKQIAQRLNLSVATVSVHLGGIFRASGTRNRSELIAKTLFPQPLAGGPEPL